VQTPRAWPAAVRLVLLLLLLAGTGACEGSPAVRTSAAQQQIRVASFDFAESRLLAEVYATALERAGYPVARLPGLGPREIVAPALQQGLADLVPEYAGSALNFLQEQGYADPPFGGAPDRDELRRRLQDALAPRGLTALSPAPGEDQNGVVVSRTTATRLSLTRLSDLSTTASRLTFGGPPECPERPLCLGGLRDRYGLAFRGFVPFASRAATAEALLAGQLDVGMLETVDPYLADGRLVLLADDRGLQPPEYVVPVLRRDVLDRHGEALVRLLDRVSATLTTEAMVELNRAVALEHGAPAVVAGQWLQRHGLG
jgi:osmoprotectant transport system substrate-binding protein